MLKFSEPDLQQLVFECGLENSQLSQHSSNSKLQFQQISQNQETIISVNDSSDDESSSFLVDENPKATPSHLDCFNRFFSFIFKMMESMNH